MATFKILPNGKILMREYIGDGVYKKAVGKTKAECRAKMRAYLADFKENKEKKSSATVKEALQLFVESKSKILSPSTIKTYCSYCENKFKDIADIYLKDLTQLDVQFSANREATKCQPKSVKNTYSFLTSVLKMYGLDFKISYPQRIKKEAIIPEKPLVLQLYEYFKSSEMFIPFLLATFLGMRRSEICGLKWCNVDFKSKTLKIDTAIVQNRYKEYVEKTTKTPLSTREVSIPDVLFSELKKRRGIGNITTLNPNVISKRFHRALIKFTDKKIRFHDLRHYAASLYHALGVPDIYIMETMGHSTDNMLKTTYLHVMKEKQQEFAEGVNEAINTEFARP